MVREVIVQTLRDLFPSREETMALYRVAAEAMQAQHTEVQITSATFEGGQTAGVLPTKDPVELLEACQIRIGELDVADGVEGSLRVDPQVSGINFASRRMEV